MGKTVWKAELYWHYDGGVGINAVFDTPEEARAACDKLTPGLVWESMEYDTRFGAETDWVAEWGDELHAWSVSPIRHGGIEFDRFAQRDWRRAQKLAGMRKAAGSDA